MMQAKPIRVLLAEDHVVVRKGLCALLGMDARFIVVGEARTGREAVNMALALLPDVILMDIALPVLNGLESTRQILAVNPKARILVLSAYSDDEYIDRFHAAGVVGFLEKQTSANSFIRGICEVAKGNTFFSASVERRMRILQSRSNGRNGLPGPNGHILTSRETEVLQLVAEGFANKQVAAELSISIKTVEKHRQHLMAKLNIHDTASLTRYAIVSGVIESKVHLTII